MRIIRLFELLFACVLLVSCQQDISGTYKAINTSDQLEKELIIIDWDGDRYFESKGPIDMPGLSMIIELM